MAKKRINRFNSMSFLSSGRLDVKSYNYYRTCQIHGRKPKIRVQLIISASVRSRQNFILKKTNPPRMKNKAISVSNPWTVKLSQTSSMFVLFGKSRLHPISVRIFNHETHEFNFKIPHYMTFPLFPYFPLDCLCSMAMIVCVFFRCDESF